MIQPTMTEDDSDSTWRQFLSKYMSDPFNKAVRKIYPENWTFPDAWCSSTSMDFIIYNKMKENNIIVRKNDPIYLRYFCVRGTGSFECDDSDCGEAWQCYNVTIIVDLYKPGVPKMYKQYCTTCGEHWGSPVFTNKQFERIVDRVIAYYKKRKEAEGTIPAIENNGSYSTKAFQAHEELHCERCRELEEPCWLHLVTYIKKVPYETVHLVSTSLQDITEPLKKLYASATVEVKDASKVCRIHINPLSGSEDIKQWRKQCETLLGSFLQNFSSLSLLVQPELFSKQITIIPKPSLSAELQTVLYITGTKEKAAEALKKVENAVKKIKQQHEVEKRKPCIILW